MVLCLSMMGNVFTPDPDIEPDNFPGHNWVIWSTLAEPQINKLINFI